jgi:hypothetical protein
MRTGWWLPCVAILLLGCEEQPGFPAGAPPGTGTGTGSPIDADVGDDDGGVSSLSGRVCELTDLRLPDECTPLARAGLVVTLAKPGGAVVAQEPTDADGRFVLGKPAGLARVLVEVDDPEQEFHKSAKLVALAGTNRVDLPMITQAYFDDLHMASLVDPEPGTGLVTVHLVKDNAPYAGVTLGALAGQNAYYDGRDDPLFFDVQGPTTERGFAIWFNVPPAGSRTYQVIQPSGATTVRNASASADAVTFLQESF